MKNAFLFLIILIFVQNSYSKKSMKLEIVDNGKKFSITMPDSCYKFKDFINIKLHLHNSACDKIFIFNPNFLPNEPTVDLINREIWYDYGGIFNPEFEMVNSLKEIDPNDSLVINAGFIIPILLKK